MNDAEQQKVDPIRQRYFVPLEWADRVVDLMFYLSAALSLAVLLIDRSNFQKIYAVFQISFLVTAIVGFLGAISVRVYFHPRAQDIRLADFLSHAFQLQLIPNRAKGYYNTSAGTSIARIAAQVLENSYFSKEIVLRMCRTERLVVGIYVVAWLLAVLNRNTDYDAMIVASQLLFSEQLISRAARIEWLRSRSEAVFDTVYGLLQAMDRSGDNFAARVVQELVKYENTKSNAVVTLSSTVFNRLNPELSEQWKGIKAELGV